MWANKDEIKPTGVVVAELMSERGYKWLVDYYGLPHVDDNYLRKFFAGEAPASPELIDALGRLFQDIPESYWRTYDAIYRLEKYYANH